MAEEERDQTSFNMAILTISQLNYSVFLCKEHMRSQNLYSLFNELIILYTGISCEMKGDLVSAIKKVQDNNKLENDKKDEIEMTEHLIKKMEPMVEKWNSNQPHSKSNVHKELFTQLRFVFMLLLKIMRESGLLMKTEDDEGL